jgi:cyclophilin family peptidyl-prolyl cis-trans isomerase
MNRPSAIEALESRIAPAVTIIHPIFDITAGIGQTKSVIDLEKMVDASTSYRTIVEFETNYLDPNTGEAAKIVIELFDDKAPVTVANFLSYVNGNPGADYDGTFFHRIFDFQGDGTTDIIQAGGFDVSNLTKHITTGLPVHNEYNAGDPEVQNVRGTIAMAKTALGPNTGTSEWFFNLTDNSSTLGGNNNGGFTVFGVIKEGLDVIDAIGNATKINKGGALTDLPVQDGYASGTPKAAQLFQITSAHVVSTAESNANDHEFGVVKVYVPGTETESTLVTATVDSANKLTLDYAPGEIGKAEVRVPVIKDGETVIDTFIVTIEPNLLSEVTTHKLPSTFIPGDQGTATVKISNSSGGVAKGDFVVRLYLSELKSDSNGDGIPDSPSLIVDAADVLMKELTLTLDLASGASTNVSVPYFVSDVANDVALINGKKYVVVSQVVPAEGSNITEVFTDDNDGARLTSHTYQQGFGQLSGRKNAVMTIDTPTGMVSFKLTGKGSGTFTRDADGGIDVTLSGTTTSSTLTVKLVSDDSDDSIHIDDLLLSSVMGNVKLSNATLDGDFMAQAGVKNVFIGTLGSENSGVDHSFSINGLEGVAPKMNATFGNVWDYSLTSNVPIGKITTTNWFDAAISTENQIFTPQIDVLRVTGDLEANLLLSTEASVKQIIVGGTLRDADLTVFGDIGTVKLGNIVGSTILAGMSTRPDDLTDFVLNRAIGSFSVTGTYSDSVVAAARFNKIALANVDKTAGSELKGIYADAIKSYVRIGVEPLKLTKLDVAGTFDVDLDIPEADRRYEVRVF